MRVLWVVTRQRPTVTIASLQCVGAQYSELNTKLLVRHRQLTQTAGSSFLNQIKELKAETELTDDLVQARVDPWGFEQKWVDEVEASKKKSAKAKANAKATGPVAATAGQPQLPELLQPVALPVRVLDNGIGAVAKAAVPKPAAVPKFVTAVPKSAAVPNPGPGPTPRPVSAVIRPVPSPIAPAAASAVHPVASVMPPVASEMPPFASVMPPVASVMPPVASEMPPVASGNSNESNPDVAAAGPTPEIPPDVGAANDEIEALAEDRVAWIMESGS